MMTSTSGADALATAANQTRQDWRRATTVIFTDLDGSLLDEETCSHRGAGPALRALRLAGIPLIPVTSKTAAEVQVLRSALDLDGPYVVENGAAIFPSEERRSAGPSVFGLRRSEMLSFTAIHRDSFGLRGFLDMTLEEISLRTGLALDGAARANLREYTEPFLMEDPLRIGELACLAEEAGLRVQQGGRFFHLTGPHDKGSAVRWLLEEMGRVGQNPVRSIGLGDSPNDLPFLNVVQEPITVPRPDGQHLFWPTTKAVRRAPFAGSRGWNAVLQEALDIPFNSGLR